MNTFYHQHYIQINTSDHIINGWSNGLCPERAPTKSDILINDQGGYQFKLIVDNKASEENPALFDINMIPLYKWDGLKVVKRSEEEIEAERLAFNNKSPEPTLQERLEAQITYTAIMTDTLIERED